MDVGSRSDSRHVPKLRDSARRDPFDRLIVAQAVSEQIPVISGDTALDTYGITRLW